MSELDEFMTELLTLCLKHEISQMSACSCCSGVNIHVGDDHAADSVEIDGRTITWTTWAHGYEPHEITVETP